MDLRMRKTISIDSIVKFRSSNDKFETDLLFVTFFAPL
jgi:hypothetical protein